MRAQFIDEKIKNTPTIKCIGINEVNKNILKTKKDDILSGNLCYIRSGTSMPKSPKDCLIISPTFFESRVLNTFSF